MSDLRVRSVFLKDEEGAGTAWWVVWMLMFMVFGGVAADSANAFRMRAELQATADAAAHAGVIDLPDVDAARASADAMAAANMSATDHGDVLAAVDIETGAWDSAANTFTVSDDEGGGGGLGLGGGGFSPADAIRVTTRRDASNSNRLKT